MFSWFSFDMSIKERLKAVKDAGFDATTLWWEGEDRHEQVDMARKFGLRIDNVHTPFYSPNQLWLDGIDGEEWQKMLISCVEECGLHEIPVAVIHLTDFAENVGVTELGLRRIGKIVDAAERKGVKLAFENLAFLCHIDAVFNRFESPHVGYCYDSGHENVCARLYNDPGFDCLSPYGHRLFALHINDNYGDGDTHAIPFNGTIDWKKKMGIIRQCKDVDYFTLEVPFERSHEKCEIYGRMAADEFLGAAYASAVKLLEL
jgi:sugar phosphate isomerase/epimerase